MNRSLLRRLSAVALSALIGGFVLGPLTAATASAADPTVIDVLTFNDFHGRIEASGASAGAAVLAGLAKQQRAANPNTLVASDVDNRLAKGFNFPLISANIIDKTTGTYAYDPYVIKTVAGVRVAFVGAITQDMPGLVSPASITTLSFSDIATSVDTVADQLKDGNEANGEEDVVVLLVHDGAADGRA